MRKGMEDIITNEFDSEKYEYEAKKIKGKRQS